MVEAVESSSGGGMVGERAALVVREFDPEEDTRAVEEMERLCDLGPPSTGGKKDTKKKKKKKQEPLLFVDHMGDPISRIRHFHHRIMLVAEYGREGEKKVVAGVIRCCIKTVTRGGKQQLGGGPPAYTKVAYILGLRVSPTLRRLGIASELVLKAEEWSRSKGAEYAYMATDRHNAASLSLFTGKLSYFHFRSPRLLVRPVHAHRLPVPASAAILRLPPPLAASLYRRLFSSAEFFPADIATVLANPLSLGTFLAVPNASTAGAAAAALPSSFAVMSLWNCKEVFRMEMRGASRAARAALRWARAADERMPWLGIPSLPDVFRPFGVYLMYGLHAEGKAGAGLMRALSRLAHNVAVEDQGCAAVIAEVGRTDPVAGGVEHWRRFSWEEDVWCMKMLAPRGSGGDCGEVDDHDDDDDWVRSQPSTDVIFVDPRDF